MQYAQQYFKVALKVLSDVVMTSHYSHCESQRLLRDIRESFMGVQGAVQIMHETLHLLQLNLKRKWKKYSSGILSPTTKAWWFIQCHCHLKKNSSKDYFSVFTLPRPFLWTMENLASQSSGNNLFCAIWIFVVQKKSSPCKMRMQTQRSFVLMNSKCWWSPQM